MKTFIIGACGGTSSGKAEVCAQIKEDILKATKAEVVILHLITFYKDLEGEDLRLAKEGKYNFDRPDAIDFDALYNVLSKVARSETVTFPQYNKRLCRHTNEELITIPSTVQVLLVEGILIFYDSRIRDLFDLKLFVDRDSDTRLCKRIRDDMHEKGIDLISILDQYKNFVKPAFEEFCLPTKKYADVIIPRGEENTVAIDLIVQHVVDVLKSAQQKNGGGHGGQYSNQNTTLSRDVAATLPEVETCGSQESKGASSGHISWYPNGSTEKTSGRSRVGSETSRPH